MSSLKQFIKSHRALRASMIPAVRLFRTACPPKSVRLSKALGELFQAVQGGSLIIRMPDFDGSFEIDSRSHVLRRILAVGEYEPEVVNLIKRKLDAKRDAIDVGANAGLFTVLLSSLVLPSSRVLAIEPTPGALRYLRSNLERNARSQNVIVFEGVASSSPGEVTLKVISGKEEFSSIGNLVHPSVRDQSYDQINVASETIDRLVDKYSLKPGFIKVDTEGAEYDVLLGCEQTMLTHRPVILCESWDDDLLTQSGGIPGAVANIFKSRGYVISQPIDGEILAVPKE
jgi:FkbM family methyltransferase